MTIWPKCNSFSVVLLDVKRLSWGSGLLRSAYGHSDIRGVNTLTSARPPSPANLLLTFAVNKGKRSGRSPRPRRRGGVAPHARGTGYSMIVPHIWRALCFLVLVQQDLDTNPFLGAYGAPRYLICKDPRLWTPVFKSPVIVLMQQLYVHGTYSEFCLQLCCVWPAQCSKNLDFE